MTGWVSISNETKNMTPKITQMVVENCDSQFLLGQIKQTIVDEVNRFLMNSVPEDAFDRILTREQTANYFDISLPTLHDWTKKGILQAHSIGGRVFYKQSSINEAIKPTKPYTYNKK